VVVGVLSTRRSSRYPSMDGVAVGWGRKLLVVAVCGPHSHGGMFDSALLSGGHGCGFLWGPKEAGFRF